MPPCLEASSIFASLGKHFLMNSPKVDDTLINPTETFINPIKTLINPIKTLINPTETFINPIKTLINPIKTLIGVKKSLVEVNENITLVNGNTIVEKDLGDGGNVVIEKSWTEYRKAVSGGTSWRKV